MFLLGSRIVWNRDSLGTNSSFSSFMISCLNYYGATSFIGKGGLLQIPYPTLIALSRNALDDPVCFFSLIVFPFLDVLHQLVSMLALHKRGANIFEETLPAKNVTASCYRSLNALTEVEEPAGMGESLGTGAHRHRSILPPGVKYVQRPWVLRRILSNRS